MFKTSVRVVWASRQVRLCLAKYPAKYVGKYRRKHRAPCIRLRRRLRSSRYLDLNRDLNPKPYVSLYRELLAKSHQSLLPQLFAELFGSMFDLKYDKLQASSRLALYRWKQLGRRSVGSGVGGRIVATSPVHTICSSRV